MVLTTIIMLQLFCICTHTVFSQTTQFFFEHFSSSYNNLRNRLSPPSFCWSFFKTYDATWMKFPLRYMCYRGKRETFSPYIQDICSLLNNLSGTIFLLYVCHILFWLNKYLLDICYIGKHCSSLVRVFSWFILKIAHGHFSLFWCSASSQRLNSRIRTSLAVQWLRHPAAPRGAWASPLVRELRAHMARPNYRKECADDLDLCLLAFAF